MFAILENGSVETMLRYRLRFSTGRAFAIPTGQSKTRMTVMTLRSCARTFIAGPTMSIIESLLVLWRLAARAKQSAPSGGNGRRVISVDRPLRLRTAPRERPGCSPASLPPEGTSWPSQRGPRRTHGGASHRAPVDCFPLVSPASRLSPILIRTPIISVVCAPRGALPLRRRRRGSTERLYGCRSRRDARSRRRNETGACRCPPRLLAARWEQGASATRAWSKPTAKMGDQDPTTTREDAGLRRKAKKDLGGGKDQASP